MHVLILFIYLYFFMHKKGSHVCDHWSDLIKLAEFITWAPISALGLFISWHNIFMKHTTQTRQFLTHICDLVQVMFLFIICAAQTVIFTIQLLNFHMLLASLSRSGHLSHAWCPFLFIKKKRIIIRRRRRKTYNS